MSSSPAGYAALLIASLSVGYWAGARWPLTAKNSSKAAGDGLKVTSNADINADTESETSEAPPGEDLTSVKASSLEECKLVGGEGACCTYGPGDVIGQDSGAMLVRVSHEYSVEGLRHLRQCLLSSLSSHATLACYKALSKSNSKLLRRWERTGQSKVALRTDNEQELDTLEAMARSLNLCAHSIHDATQIAAGSRTVVGIGPGPAQLVNKVTGKLRLL